MPDTQGRREAEPVQDDKAMEADEAPTLGRVVDVDVPVSLYGIELADETSICGLTDRQIRDDINGMALYVQGRKLVLVADGEPDPERFFFSEELSGEAVAVSAHIDGRTLTVLAHWCQVILTQSHDIGLVVLTAQATKEIEAAIANVKSTMEGTSVEVRGGG